jgi:hypothetical protein
MQSPTAHALGLVACRLYRGCGGGANFRASSERRAGLAGRCRRSVAATVLRRATRWLPMWLLRGSCRARFGTRGVAATVFGTSGCGRETDFRHETTHSMRRWLLNANDCHRVCSLPAKIFSGLSNSRIVRSFARCLHDRQRMTACALQCTRALQLGQ